MDKSYCTKLNLLPFAWLNTHEVALRFKEVDDHKWQVATSDITIEGMFKRQIRVWFWLMGVVGASPLPQDLIKSRCTLQI